jgi:hypothetical protein
VVARVRDEQRPFVQKEQPLRVVEGGLGEGPVLHAPRPGSGDGDYLDPFAGLVHARHDYAVVAGVGDGEEAVRAGGDLAGEAQGAGAGTAGGSVARGVSSKAPR